MAASSTSDAASAHAAVGSLVHKTQELAGVLLQLRQQPDASDELASRARALNAECEQHWAVVASAAASIDAAGASQAQGSSSGDEASEVAALEHQRRELQEVRAGMPAAHTAHRHLRLHPCLTPAACPACRPSARRTTCSSSKSTC